MGNRVSAPLRGFLVPSPGITLANLSATDSSYTEAAPRPGAGLPSNARSRSVLQASGAQEEGYRLIAEAAGMPTLTGGRWLYRRTADVDSQANDRGWNPEQVLSLTGTVIASDATSYDLFCACVIPSSQKVVVVYNSGATTRFKVYDPVTATWSAADNIANTTAVSGAIWVGADERLYFASGVAGTRNVLFYSDDEGANWTEAATNIFDTNPTTYRRVVRLGDELMCISHQNTAGTLIRQHASSTLGTSWTNHSGDVSTWDCADATATPSGKIVVLLKKDADNRLYSTTLGSVWEPFNGPTPVTVSSTTFDGDISVWATPDGRVWATARKAADYYLFYSDDDGITWVQADYGWYSSGDTSTYPTIVIALPTAGGSLIIHQGVGSPSSFAAKSIYSCFLGGWSSITFGEDSLSSSAAHLQKRIGFGRHGTAITNTWIPLDTPSDVSYWSASGTGTDVLGAGFTTITTSADTRYFSKATSTNRAVMLVYGIQLLTGGGMSGEIGSDIAETTGASSTSSRVSISETDISLVSTGGGTSTVSVDAPNAPLIIAHFARNGKHWAYFRSLNDNVWILIGYHEPTPSGLAAGFARWGHPSAGTGESQWLFCNLFSRATSDTPFGAWQDTDATLRDRTGKPLTLHPFPIGNFTEAGLATFLRASDGPVLAQEVHTIAEVPDYPAAALHPTVAPSPRVTFRSRSTSSQTFVWTPDGTNRQSLGSRTHMLGVLNSNVHQIVYGGHDGSSWTTLATWSAKVWTGLTWTRTGNTIRITAGSGRYVWRDELVGASFDLAGNGSVVRKIVAHSEGLVTAGNHKHVELVLDGITGAESSSGSAGAIIARNWIGVVHDVAGIYSKYRVVVSAATSTPESYFYIGSLILGTLVQVGQTWDWGIGRENAPTAEDYVGRDGSTRRRRAGPPMATWTLGWTEGVDLTALNRGAVDSIGPGGEALANVGDVPWLTWGLISELQSGATPVVVCAAIPGFTGVISDPTTFLYGRIVSSAATEHVLGEEGDDELLRLNTVTIQGIT